VDSGTNSLFDLIGSVSGACLHAFEWVFGMFPDFCLSIIRHGFCFCFFLVGVCVLVSLGVVVGLWSLLMFKLLLYIL